MEQLFYSALLVNANETGLSISTVEIDSEMPNISQVLGLTGFIGSVLSRSKYLKNHCIYIDDNGLNSSKTKFIIKCDEIYPNWLPLPMLLTGFNPISGELDQLGLTQEGFLQVLTKGGCAVCVAGGHLAPRSPSY